MPYVDLEIPPGVYANGTARQAKGRWCAANLVRWPNGPDLQPVGGWRLKNAATPAVPGKARAMVTWRDNAGSRWAAVGTNNAPAGGEGLFVFNAAGSRFDITPAGYAGSKPDAELGGGYGGGAYNAPPGYGQPRLDDDNILPAAVWTLDTWGQHLVACCEGDGKLYEWTLDSAVAAQPIAAAPTGLRGVVVTAENFIFALGDRRVSWCDQADSADWTPAATNQAGDLDLQTPGRLMCGRRVRGATLVFSDVDVWAATYLGGVAVYGFQRAGADCGVLAKGAAVSLDGRCVWMGRGAFFAYDGGAVADLPCEIADHVFQDLNEQQASKVTAWHNADHGEVWWHYPSAASLENDRYAAWCYRTGTWSMGQLARTCGASAGVFQNPLLMAPDGRLWEHEVGWDWSGAQPFARSAPLEIGAGDRVMAVSGVIGDERTRGEAQVRFFTRAFPNGAEAEQGPYPLTRTPADARFSARQVETEVAFTAAADSRVGVLRLDVQTAGRR
ncbi:MAG: hypothetical protein K1X35_09930 [Caulobacteraceae bacterium]|nr:hypothetical protein [Caulobacteraceae bacterium]